MPSESEMARRIRRDSLERAAAYRAVAFANLDGNNIAEAKEAALSALIFERDAEKQLERLRAEPKETTSCQAK